MGGFFFQIMKIIAQRDSNGVVTTGEMSATIPQEYSMIGVLATNGIINGGDYREDGFVYINNKPVKKWHITQGGIRLWQPKLNDLQSLYKLYKKTRKARDLAWNEVREVLKKLWGNNNKDYVVKAHVQPTHKFTIGVSSNPWWEYNIRNDETTGICYGFDWLDEKPKKLCNPELGQELYNRERRYYHTISSRHGIVRQIFYEAMKKSLPKPTENKAIVLQFDTDNYWFHTDYKMRNFYYWEMFDNNYSFEMKRIV